MNARPDPAARSAGQELLCCRMATLGLDCDAVARNDRDLFATLKQRCGECEFPDGCAHDLSDDPSSPVWEAYCPNSALLARLSGA